MLNADFSNLHDGKTTTEELMSAALEYIKLEYDKQRNLSETPQ